MNVDFTVNFFGGIGHVEIQIRSHGNMVGSPLVFDTDDETQTRDLDPGFYILSVTGNASPGGTDLTISSPTTPNTPDHLPAGPILKAYSLHV
jgi:hypothetical protein